MSGIRWVGTVAALVALAGCGGDTAVEVSPELTLVAGTYSAEGSFGAMVLTTRQDGSTQEVDWLALGGSLRLDLRADGTTAGRLFVPGGDEDGADLDADMAGSWTVSDGVVRVEQEADTFLRDTPLVFEDGVLTGERSFGDVMVRVVLRRR